MTDTTDRMTAEWTAWCGARNHKPASVDEFIFEWGTSLSKDDYAYCSDFIGRWDVAQEREDFNLREDARVERIYRASLADVRGKDGGQ